MTVRSGGRTTAIKAISFDFGNTLVPVSRADLRAVVAGTTSELARRCGPFDEAAFAEAWAQEGARQFAEDVPQMREIDLAQRSVRVLARMRGMPCPDPSTRWDDDAAAGWSSPDEIDLALSTYTAAFLATIAPPPSVGPLLARLAARFTLGICSNWPLGVTIDRFVEQAGWASHLTAIVVSQRVGTIKPDVRIFRAAEVALQTPPEGILHVGDDWLADIVGAKDAGWMAGYLATDPSGSPFPVSPQDDRVEPDLRLRRLADLEERLA